MARGNAAGVGTVGFVLLTHNKPYQAIRLFNTLNRMFNHPPIAWHHDFGLCDLPPDLTTTNAQFVRPHIRTEWGKFSVVDATISALDLLVRLPHAPDWFVLLSGADYPIKTADAILQDFKSSQFDVHIRYERIIYNQYERDWQQLCYDRYCSLKFRIPSINKRFHPKKRTITINHPLIASRLSPFDKITCFAGEHWFCGKIHAAEYLVNFYKTQTWLADHYRKRDVHTISPDELYYQTVFLNSKLKVSNNFWRYIEWPVFHSLHPNTLTIKDLNKLNASDAHFARKFDVNADNAILDVLDSQNFRS